MAQQIINTGTGPDTGDGDDLYVAFTKVNENFNSLWQFGPVDSNVRIANNTISVSNTNGNLILNPQGVGIVQVNNSIFPRFHNTYSLGTSDLRFRSAYFGTGGVEISGNLTVNGNLFGNINLGNVVVADVQGNIISDNGNILINAVSESLSVASANVSGVINSGNILPLANATYTLGNVDLQWKDLWLAGNTLYLANAAITVVDGQLYYAGNLVVTQAGNTLSVPGNLVVDTLTANISIVTPNANVTGNISAGNVLTDSLLYANGVPYNLGQDPGGSNTQVQFNDGGTFGGSPAFTFDSAANTVSVLGNVTAESAQFNAVSANSFTGDGSGLTNLPAGSFLGNGTSNVSVPVASGNVVFTVGAVSNVMTVTQSGADILGNLTVSGNIVGNLFVGDGRALTRVMAQRGSDPDNWNTLTEMGVYKVNRTSWSGTTGTPLDSSVFKGLLQVASETDGITQIFYPGTVTVTNVKLQWARSYLDGTWTSWYKIVNDDQTLEGGAF